ncbi:TPA: hypothetical protein I3798_004858 [Enterobacter cloacae]|uniref:hypothetical protein n=1 Tax=Enterobacter cloacae TaxID=550 RepID=UPI00294CB72A|nr:hypothetical protein [Enterobacter cloacae]HED6270141.1 hypothetical protein [Enterobacter sichuanensis]HAS1066437.1 hypothetical protein [Enterobacter cloacae]HAS1116446.1 hypothetical protein [Enterobacter cloacae]HAS1121402.1 hypothetical protein [Enterobacter cloacae]
MIRKHNLDNAYQMVEGQFKFLDRNTGLTTDNKTQHYVFNPDNVLANNRHFIAETQWEAQPDGDATTEGQSLQILGALHCYQATKEPYYLEKAKQYFDAYHLAFYRGVPFPDPPSTALRCNWICNGKAPVLANYPLDPEYPTHGGFKGVLFNWVNGQTKIPYGAPNYGEYLDAVWFAFPERASLGWNQVNATAYMWLEDGSTDWKTKAPTYDVDWIIDRTGRKVDSDGEVLEQGLTSQIGTVQLKNTSINGNYRFNYATRNPVEHGGYMFARNERWHNRPVNVPIDNYGDLDFADNASDAELWFCLASKMLYDITGERKHYLAWQCSLLTCYGYSDIDKFDMFFRKSTIAKTPFTDGISYDYFYPSNQVATYSRDAEGYIVINQSASAQTTLEQQSIWFKFNNNSNFHIEYGGVDTTGVGLGLAVKMTVNKTKVEEGSTLYRCGLPNTSPNGSITVMNVPMNRFTRVRKPDGGEYLTADMRNISDYGSNTVTKFEYQSGIVGKYYDNVITSTMDGDGGMVIGFYIYDQELQDIKSFTYRTYNDNFNIRITDDNGWRWWAMLPANNGVWVTQNFSQLDFKLNSYQPNHSEGDEQPAAVTLTGREDFTILLDDDPVDGVSGRIDWYCVNELPELYDDGGTGDYSVLVNLTFNDSTSSGYTARLGDCTIKQYMLSSLAYTPGLIPFSNITDPYAQLYSGWRGLPYPGYQLPTIWCFKGTTIDTERLNNSINFLCDAQDWFTNKFHPTLPGPCAQAFVWNRQDALAYLPEGEKVDTFIMDHFYSEAWSGYEPRAFYAGCNVVHELWSRGDYTIPTKIIQYCKNWMNYLKWFMKNNNGHAPTRFKNNGEVIYDGFTPHMSGLWLAGACIMAIAGYPDDELIQMLFDEVQSFYEVITPNHVMNGTWAAAIRSGTPTTAENNSMFFGFYSGEVLRGLGLYIEYYNLHK